MDTFGPVPSRRLGRSLGINNIPPKVCSYSCVYCQLGRTGNLRVGRRAFYDPEAVAAAVRDKVARARQAEKAVDYLAFVPDGEPTLDVNLGREIDLLRPLKIPIAVITNASLVWQEDVRADLARADWVSLKVDATREGIWRRIDRPHGALRLPAILEGMLAFAKTYRGELVTETMLVGGVNDDEECVREIADFLSRLRPGRAYLSVPIRPPAEAWAHPPSVMATLRAYQIFGQRLSEVEHLIGYEGNAFACTGDATEDLLSITAVHPMRKEAVDEFLDRAGAGWSVVRELLDEGRLVETEYEGTTFYARRLQRKSG